MFIVAYRIFSCGQIYMKTYFYDCLALTTCSIFFSAQMTSPDWLSVLRLVLTSRMIDLIEENELVPQGLVTYQFSSRGHELAQVLLAEQLTHAHDGAGVYYRSRPFVLGAGMSIREAFAGPLGRATGRSGGRDIGVVHNLPKRKAVTVLPTAGDVGSQFTPAAGWAQAITYRAGLMKEAVWKDAIAVVCAGDGAVATNGFWSSLTMATTLSLPLLFFIEDNGYGISVPSVKQTPHGNIADNLKSFGNLKILQGDGSDPESASKLIAEAVHFVRSKRLPALVRVRVPRLSGHSGADNQSYKTPEERADEERRDPLNTLKSYILKKKILTKAALAAFEANLEKEIRAELALALADPEPEPQSATRFAFFDGTLQEAGGMAAEGVTIAGAELPSGAATEGQRVNMIEAIRRVLSEELAANPRVAVFGEDVGAKGGVHGATVDLQRLYGADRVFDTSLSEEGIIGRSVGMALAGLVPVPEIQFRKYADPAMEQLHNCGTLRWRTNGAFAAPIVVRMPGGYGKRTADPWHSVSGEVVFAHAVGWQVAFPSNAADAAGLLRSALRGNNPTIFFEHRALLDTSSGRAPYPGGDYTLPFGVAAVLRSGTEATIVTWGEMVHRALEVAQNLASTMEKSVEVIDLRTIMPWDRESIAASVKKTGRCLVLHEDTFTAGFGGEVASFVAQECFRWLDAPVERMASADVPMAYNPILTAAIVPSVEVIAERMKRMLAF
jgi:2-oxoisovalerate dehydrogenase E1 component